ncbi:MAG: hypothetical protein QXY62_05675 [Candidatus Altiarchaeota archaeon]
MACFLVPLGIAVITTLMRKKFPKNLHVEWLNSMLYGGVLMLAVEHIAHGEVVPYPPFLTKGIEEILPEMIKIGLPMIIFVFIAWYGIVIFSEKLKLKNLKFAKT